MLSGLTSTGQGGDSELADDYATRNWLLEQVKEEQQYTATVENVMARISIKQD